MSEVARLMAGRQAAIERGDKALGREIFHQLVNMGVSPDEITTGQLVERPPVLDAPVETTAAPPPPEAAVKRPLSKPTGARTRRKKG